MTNINKVAVIGSGVMGAGIAAHIANSGTEVLLFDIVPEGASDRNQLAKAAIEKAVAQTKKDAQQQMLTHKRNAKRITPCNLEDDLKKIAEVDWIIEVVLERLDVKQNLYQKLEEVRKDGSVVSSNTSTLPLAHLVEGMPERFKQDFMITHFFNPPRYMRLLELVTSEATKKEHIETITAFCDERLGKGVVPCNDTPGFIANRIGIFWLTVAINRALKMKVDVQTADAVMSRPIGVPKTGVFGLMDLIGIDLLPLIAESYGKTLDKSDRFFAEYTDFPVITKMIEEGYTGRKGKGGFYRLNTEGGKKVKETKNLLTGEYAYQDKPKLASVGAAKGGLRKLVEHEDAGGRYAREVLLELLSYAASLVGEVSDSIYDIDRAMRMGYNWKYGPFELIDRLGGDDMAGPKWLALQLEEAGKDVPAILKAAGDQPFYQVESGELQYLTPKGDYTAKPQQPDAWMLADIKRGNKPVAKNASAALWDLGDGILCLEFTSKMNTIDPLIFDMMDEAIALCGGATNSPLAGESENAKTFSGGGTSTKGSIPPTESRKRSSTPPQGGSYRGLVIANDADNFCVGANIGLALFGSNVSAWKMLGEFIKRGQDTFMKLKYGNFPVVSAPSGMALGGGCEVLLHSDAVNAHVELYTGLVEVGVGIIPGWGGCKEMLFRHIKAQAESDTLAAKFGNWFSWLSPVRTLNVMPPLKTVFEAISLAKVAKSAEQAKSMRILNERSRITMNRERVLPDAKALCLELAKDYQPPESYTVQLPGKTARVALDIAINQAEKAGKALPHDVTVSKALGYVLSGGETDIRKELTEQNILDLERAQFDHLLRTPETLARIEHMLETGKPLRN